MHFNYQRDIAERQNDPSDKLFEKVDLKEISNIDNVFKDFIDSINPNDKLTDIKIDTEIGDKLRFYIDKHYEELQDSTDNKIILDFFYSMRYYTIDSEGNVTNPSNLWSIDKNPYLRNFVRMIITFKKPKVDGDKTIQNTGDIKNLLDKIAEKEKESTSSEKFNKFQGNGFFEKFKNAKGLDKLSVIRHKLGSFIDKPVDFISNFLDNVNNAVFDAASGDFSFIKNAFNRLTGKAYGDKNLSRSGLYVLSKGEAVIPSHLNPWNPNRSSADPRKDAQSENNLLARLSQSGVPISGSFAEGTAVVNPDNNDNRSIIEKVRDTVVGAGNKLSMFIDSHTGNAITVTKEKADDIVDKAQTKVEELQDKATSLTGKVFDYFKNTFSDTLGRGAGGALIGGLLTGGNPMGILLGGSISILMGMAKKSNIITDTLFGNNFDKKGISKYIPASIRKQAKNIKDYGLAGSIAGFGIGAIGGPLGLVGGALLGSTVGYLKDNDEAKTLLFGPGLGENLKKLFKTKEKMKYTAVGGTIGGLLGGPLGVVGGALVGSSLSFITTSEKFKEMMFGKKEGDKVVKEGLIDKIDKFFGDNFANNRKGFIEYLKEAITNPIEQAMVPVGTALQVGVREAVKGLESALKKFVQADISSKWGRLGQSIQKNKWMSGAVGGALGGMMMGGPIGGILGGVLGSVAHGTGFDKTLFNFGKEISLLPGKGLNFISNRLTKWEINSGNGFNWTAQERLDKGGDDYKKTSYGKADIALSKMNKSELIMLQSLVKGIDNLDEATKYATEELMRAIDRVLAVSGLSITEQDNIKEILATKKEKTEIGDINDIITKSNNIGLTRKKEIIDELKPRIESFISTMAYVESLKDRGVRDAAIKEAANKLGIDESELQDKDKREKFTMYSAKEIANRDGEEKINIEAQDVTTQAGDKVVDALGYNVTRLMNFMRLMQKDYLKDDKVKISFDAFGNATMYKEIKDENGHVTDIEIIDNEINANGEEEKKKIKEAILGTAENTKQIAENSTKEKPKKIENNKKKSDLDIIKQLKSLGKSITDIVLGPLKLTDAVLESIPIVGKLYKNAKFQIGTFAGQKIFRPLSKSILSKANKWVGLSNVRVNGKQLSNNMISGINTYQKVTNKLGGGKWAQRAGKAAGTATRIAKGVGGRVLKGIGTAIGFAADMFDSMAVANAANEAAEQVQAQDLDDNQALNSIAASSAGIMAGLSAQGAVLASGLQSVRDAVQSNGILDMIPGKGGTISSIASKAAPFLKKGAKHAAIAAVAAGVGYVAVKSGLVSEETALKSAETTMNASRVTSFINMAYKAICKVASKFLSPENATKLINLGEKLTKVATNDKVLKKISKTILSKAAGFLGGPLGWALLVGSTAKSFYDGFSDAESYWQPKKGEEMTITKKVICGLTAAITEFCCLDLIMSPKEILQFIKNALGFSPKELEAGGGGDLFSLGSNGMTIFNVKSWMNKLDNSIFDFKLFDKINLTDAYKNFKDMLSGLWNKAIKKVGDALESVKKFGADIADWWKNFSVADAINGLINNAKEYINNLFNFDVKEKSKELIQEDANQLDVRQLDEDDNELVEKYKASLNLNDGFNIKFSNGTKKSNHGNIAEYKAKGVQQMLDRNKKPFEKPGDGDGGYFGIGEGDGIGNTNDNLSPEEIALEISKNTSIPADLLWAQMAHETGNFSSALSAHHNYGGAKVGYTGTKTKNGRSYTVLGQDQYGHSFFDSDRSYVNYMSWYYTHPDYVNAGILNATNATEWATALKNGGYYEDSIPNYANGIQRFLDSNPDVVKRLKDGNPEAYDISKKKYNIPSSTSKTLGPFNSTSATSSGTSIFDNIIKKLESGALGKLGAALFGSASFFTNGLFGSFSGGGAGSSRSYSGSGSPRGKGKPNDKGVLTEEPEDGAYWVRQTSGVTLKGCHVQVLDVLDCLGKFFFQKTGKKLVVTAGTNGQHAQGEYSHASGWKVDVNDWYGPEGLKGGWITDGASFTHDFKRFGHDNGLGMADEGDHIDVQFADGYDWQDKQYYGGWDAVHGGKNKTSVVDFLTNSLHGNITGKFGEPRTGGAHGGIDIATSLGTNIISPISGRVSNIGIEPGGYGNYIQIKDDQGKYHLFGHLKETPKLELNNKIEPGQTIGFVGSSGKSTGPHVHYQIDPESNHRAMKAGQHIDPSTYMIDQSTIDKINANNSSVADFKRNEYIDPNSGDGGIIGVNNLSNIAAINKENLEGLKPIDYEQKFDMIIQLLSSIVSLLGGANKASNFNANINTNNIPATIAGGIGGGLTNTPKFATTAPGKSIESILANMISLAKGT